jgi:hypothetical protein
MRVQIVCMVLVCVCVSVNTGRRPPNLNPCPVEAQISQAYLDRVGQVAKQWNKE